MLNKIWLNKLGVELTDMKEPTPDFKESLLLTGELKRERWISL